jgi:membrane associated rhomboid family serine protease
MEPGQKVDPLTTDDPTPLPLRVDALAPPRAPHTPAAVLLAIAAVGDGGVWFPSRYAAEAGISRDLLDDPLAELRVTGLVRVAAWERGVGQGYALTAEGRSVASDPAAVEVALESIARPAAEATADPSPDAPAAAPKSEFAFAPPVVVPALLMANVLWFFVCVMYSIRWGLTPARALSEGHPDVLQRFGAVSGAWLLEGEWWRLVSSCFVHIGALHLLGNMFALAMMGPLAELLWGRGRLVLIYFVSGLAGSCLAMIVRPDTILAGASGAIWGIQMSLFAWLLAFRTHLPPAVADDWLRRLLVVFVLNAGVSFLPNVSWEGHLGGGAAGFATAGLLNAARFGGRVRRASACILLALVPVACVAALVAATDALGLPRWQRVRQQMISQAEARAAVARHEALRDALVEYRAKAEPRLAELSPDHTKKSVLEGTVMALRSNRPPERVEAIKAQLMALRTAAAAAQKHTPAAPLGDDEFDRLFARARAAAAARQKALDLLLALLDAPPPPAPEAWSAWEAARRDADRLWAEWRGR